MLCSTPLLYYQPYFPVAGVRFGSVVVVSLAGSVSLHAQAHIQTHAWCTVAKGVLVVSLLSV